jgi:predicted patatin/cPLA2 family phospholipase
VVLTRNEGYRKEAASFKGLLKAVYRKRPLVFDAMCRRHDVYNRQLDLCERLEKEGKALIIRPQKKLQMDRSERDTRKLLALFEEGREEGSTAIDMLKAME